MKENPYKKLRKGLGLTQVQFGQELGVSGGRVHQLEHGICGAASAAVLSNLNSAYSGTFKRHGVTLPDFVECASE